MSAVTFLLTVATAIWLPAQTVALKTFGADSYDSTTNLIQASDGNLYGVSFGGTSAAYSCPDKSANECTFIVRITPDGTATNLHTFERNGTTGASDGYAPSSLIEAPDGNLYGTTAQGGSTGYGTIFRMTVAGVFTTLYTFPSAGNASDPNAPSPGAPNGVSPGPLVLGDDGNFYGTTQGAAGGFGFFQLTPSGNLTMLHAPDKAESQYDFPNPLLQADDANFYTSTATGIVQIAPSGSVRSLYTFPADGSGGAGHGVLVEGADKYLYGTSQFSGYDAQGVENGKGIVYKISTSGFYKELYRFTGNVDGFNVNPELTLGSDGSFYGTTYSGGKTLLCNDSGPGCGTVFQESPTAGFTSLYAFSQDATDAQRPEGRLVQDSDGSFIGSFNADAATSNTAFRLSLQPALQAPVQLAFDSKTVNPNDSVKLTWKVLNAFSATMQQCHASVLNSATGASSGAGTWTGPQTGSLMGTVYTGNAIITPTAAGTYTYVLNCGGIETGSVSLTVGNGPTITTASLPDGAVGKSYLATVQTTGGTLPYHYSTQGSLPDGITIDANSGTLSGTAKQFGVFAFAINVQDSATPPLTNSAAFRVTVASTLALISTLANPTVNTAYNVTAQVTGGLAPYKWAVTAGSLPDGLTLNANNGAITGTPTTVAKYTFSITVTDGEGNPATYTRAYTVSTMVPQLAIDEGILFNCTVNVSCQGQFTATGGQPPYTWAVAPGRSFPAGLTLNSNGSLTGKPLQYSVTGPDDLPVQVTDSETPPVQVSGLNSLKVVSGLKIVSVTLPAATVGMPYASPAPVASGGLPPYIWKSLFYDSQVVKEYTIDPATGVLASSGPVTPGTYLVTFYLSDSEGTPDIVSQSANLVVNPATVTSSTTLSVSSATAGTGMNVVLTATVSSSGGATGMVTFLSGTTVLGTASLGSNGTASLTTSFNTAGVFSLTAAYSGNGTSAGSVSSPLLETVVTPTVSASLAPGTLTLTAGQSGTIVLTLNPNGGYTGTVTFSCDQLPAHVSCTFAPPSLTIAAGATSVTDTLTINSAAPLVGSLRLPWRGAGFGIEAAGLFWFPASMLAFFGLRRKPGPFLKLLSLAWLALCFAGALTLTGCGSTAQNLAAPPGTYSIPVTFTLSGGVKNSVNATVIVR